MILLFELFFYTLWSCAYVLAFPQSKIPICHFLPTIFPFLTIPTHKTSFLVHMPSAPRSCPAFQSQSEWIFFFFCLLISVLLETFCLDFYFTVISLVLNFTYHVAGWTVWNYHYSIILSYKTWQVPVVELSSSTLTTQTFENKVWSELL